VAPDEAADWLMARHAGLVAIPAWGETALFHNPDGRFARGAYFATIKTDDGAHDRASRLGRGRWRLNFGLSTADYASLFGPKPARPAKGSIIEGPWDFQATGVLTPHPVYGWMGWAAIINPEATQLDAMQPLLAAAHARAARTWAKRISRARLPARS
jgi:hypothetical protein